MIWVQIAINSLKFNCTNYFFECLPYFELVHIVFFAMGSDYNEPPHVHVERDNKEAKFWLSPVRLQKNKGFNSNEINRIQKLVDEYQKHLLEKWDDFFNG